MISAINYRKNAASNHRDRRFLATHQATPGLLDQFGVGKQRGGAAGMQEHRAIVCSELGLA